MRDTPTTEHTAADGASTRPRQDEPVRDLEAFAWAYAQKSGELRQDDSLKNDQPAAIGYSGAGAGKNNPEMQNLTNVGPIPQGNWTICGPPFDSEDHGPYVLRLQPAAETETFGRTGFLMHGDSKEHPGSASRGCIILPRAVREQVWTSGDHDLKVVSGNRIVAPGSEEKG